MSGKALVSELATALNYEALTAQPADVRADATRKVRRNARTAVEALLFLDMLGLDEEPLAAYADADRRASARYHVGVRVRGRKLA